MECTKLESYPDEHTPQVNKTVSEVAHESPLPSDATQIKKAELPHGNLESGIDLDQTSVENTNLVSWESGDDPKNPTNWPKWKKWRNMSIVAAIIFIA
jgi:hypothetical protein